MYNNKENFICNMNNKDKFLCMAALTLSKSHDILYIKNIAYNVDGTINKNVFGFYTRNTQICNKPFWDKFNELKNKKNYI